MTKPIHTSHRELLDAAMRVSRKLRTTFNARVEAEGMTYARARALSRLADCGSLSQKELACELDLEQATTGRLLDRMEELDLIRREPDPDDRRAKKVLLTDHGTTQAARIVGISREIRDQLFAELSLDEILRTTAVLEQIERRIGTLSATKTEDDS